MCGRGELAVHLHKYSNHIIAIDGSKDMLNEAIRKDGIQYFLCDVNSQNFLALIENYNFSSVFIGRAIHWIHDNALKQLRQHISKNSANLIVLYSDFSNDNPWIDEYRSLIYNLTGKNLKSEWLYKDRVLNSGFKFHSSIKGNFILKIDINFLYLTAFSRSIVAHTLKDQQDKFRSQLTTLMNPFIQNDKSIIARVTNYGDIYQSMV